MGSRDSRSDRRPFGWALAAGLCIAAAMPPWGWWPLAPIGLVILSRRELAEPVARRRFALVAIAGAAWFLPAMSWMWFLSAPGYLVAVAIFALLHGAASALGGAVDRDLRFVGLPAAHSLVEALRLSFPFGGVPLATLGISQVAGPIASVARVGGVLAITWVAWQFAAVVAGRSGASRRFGIARRFAACAIVGVIALAWFAPSGSDTGRLLDVAAVQGGGPQGTRAIDTDPREVTVRHLAATRDIRPKGLAPDVVIWPENVVDVPHFASSREFHEIASLAHDLDAPFLVGVTEDVDAASFTNAQVVVGPAADLEGRYDKVRRVPFGEYMPFRRLLRRLGAPVDLVPRDAVAGRGPAVLDVHLADGRDERVAVAISWEIFFGGRAREGVKHGGGVLVNPTNGSSYTWTVLQTQQIASSRLRAIETGRWVVQVAPTGFSAFVSPHGRVHDRTAVGERAVIARAVPIRRGSTIYTRLGDGPWIAALVVAYALALVGRFRVRSSRSPDRR